MAKQLCVLLLCLVVSWDVAGKTDKRPNIIWLHVESTDGRTWQSHMTDILPIPNIRSLQRRGVNFVNAYADVPICCPSRASTMTGRRPHNIPHMTNGIRAGGAWNNYDGVGPINSTFDRHKIYDRLADENCTVRVTGKNDYWSGGHSLTTLVDSATIYARWPYNIPEEGGFHIWGDCGGNITVNPGNESAHKKDWQTLSQEVSWLRSDAARQEQPFFLYQGFYIVHPPYRTDEEHLSRIPMGKVTVPEWPSFDSPQIHACDLYQSMKKGCARPGLGLNTTQHKRQIRSVYYAMIAEFDDMVGAYVAAAQDAGLTEKTIFIVTSDHGDMQMEHMQFYKMSAYEGSSRVPMVFAGPGIHHHEVHSLTSLIDLMPTILELAGAPKPPHTSSAGGRDLNPLAVDGTSLVPMLRQGDKAADSHPDHVISQFHGETVGASWYMIRRGDIKYIVWGTGQENVPQLFNLSSDPDEWHNLVSSDVCSTTTSRQQPCTKYALIADEMDKLLRTGVDYPVITKEVATYNLDLARWWVANEPHWKGVLNGSKRGTLPMNTSAHPVLNHDWGLLWQEHPSWYFDAWEQWIRKSNGSGLIPSCPSTLTYAWPNHRNSSFFEMFI